MREYLVRIKWDTYRISLPETPAPGAVIFGVRDGIDVRVLNIAFRPSEETIWLECEVL